MCFRLTLGAVSRVRVFSRMRWGFFANDEWDAGHGKNADQPGAAQEGHVTKRIRALTQDEIEVDMARGRGDVVSLSTSRPV